MATDAGQRPPGVLGVWAEDGAVSRELLVGVTERCSVGAIGALELFDGFARSGAPRAASAWVA